MRTIRHTNTLSYCDGPQVFEARDTIGGHYVAVMVEQSGGCDSYLVAGVAPGRLRQFRSGATDLRSLLTDGGDVEWYLATAEAGLDAPLALVVQNDPLAQSQLLPEPGFVLHGNSVGEWVLKDSVRTEQPRTGNHRGTTGCGR